MKTLLELTQEAREYATGFSGRHLLAKQAGVSARWLAYFIAGKIRNPGTELVQRVLDHKSGIHRGEDDGIAA